MKKILLFLVATFSLVSCLDNDKYYVSQNLTIHFDELNSIEQGRDLFSEPDQAYMASPFYIGGVAFNCSMSDSDPKEYLGGFCLSRLADTTVFTNPQTLEQPTLRYGMPVAEDTLSRANIFVLWRDEPNEEIMPEHAIVYTMGAYGAAVGASIKVCPTLQMVGAFMGQGGYQAFGKGDWLKVVFTGYLGDEVSGKAECYLFQETELERKMVTDWTELSLLGINSFTAMDIDIESNREDFPRYVCLDDFFLTVTIGEK